MPRAIVRADFEALFKLYADKAVKRFNMTGNHPPQLYSVKLGKEPGQIEKSGSLNKVAPMFFDGTVSKDGMRDLLQQLTTPGSVIRKAAAHYGAVVPDVVVQINETWITIEARPEGASIEEWKKRERIPPSEHPDRKEAICVFLHCYHYTTIGVCPIKEKPKRHAEMGELEPEDGRMEGRYSMTVNDEEN